ncbi:amidohydrolase family protein [Brevibacterium casei]
MNQPVLFTNATVLTMDGQPPLENTDVLIKDDSIAAIGADLEVPPGAFVIDAAGGILMPGMVDTHRHMWQTAMRGYGADWTLTQYFVWYYLEHGTAFRPEDIAVGNLLSAWDALESGVTTTVDWSHGLETVDHAEAALDALEDTPGRFVFAPGNIYKSPWEWSKGADFVSFVNRRNRRDPMLSFQLAFDVTGDPAFPERGAFEMARELGLTVNTHAGVWGATTDESLRLMHEAGFMDEKSIYVHAATFTEDSYQRIAATGGSVSLSTESEQSCGQGYPPSWELRRHGIPVSLSVDTSVWFSGDHFAAMRSTLGADRSREHLRAHEAGETVTHSALRAEEVVNWATMGGARALGLDSHIGSIEVGKKADVVLLKNDQSPTWFPIVNPYGHVVLQAGRGDVHTVLVNGRMVKHDHRLLGVDLAALRTRAESTVDHLRSRLGEETWISGMNPEIPETKVLDNPYMYTDYRSDRPTQAAK